MSGSVRFEGGAASGVARVTLVNPGKLNALSVAMLACDIPLVAQIDGACIGGGLEIAACCDIRIAGASSRFGVPIAKHGFPMAPAELEIVAAEALHTAERIACLSPQALRLNKRALRAFAMPPFSGTEQRAPHYAYADSAEALRSTRQ